MHGQPRAILTQQRLLQYPDGGGGGIYNETTDEDDLKEMAISLLRALEWHGPAQVEFMRERRTGRPYLLEVNGRFWGSMDLAVAAGMDFPVLTCKMAARGDVETQLDYRVGLRFRWPFPYAILHAMETGRWAGAFKDFLAPRKATRSDLVVTDPMPLIMEFYYTLERLWKRRFKTLRNTKDWAEFIVQDKSE
jgi:predicted ATP-grasp superfamily ATP-dependent carboligase